MGTVLKNEELILNTELPKITVQNETWPPEIRVSIKFLVDSDPRFVSIQPRYFVLWLTNGSATYRFMRWDYEASAIVCELVESEGPRE